jgi:hypothetical protein
MSCRICGRPLTSERSSLRGMGPTCARREAMAPYLFPEAFPGDAAVALLTRGPDGILTARAPRRKA